MGDALDSWTVSRDGGMCGLQRVKMIFIAVMLLNWHKKEESVSANQINTEINRCVRRKKTALVAVIIFNKFVLQRITFQILIAAK